MTDERRKEILKSVWRLCSCRHLPHTRFCIVSQVAELDEENQRLRTKNEQLLGRNRALARELKEKEDEDGNRE